MASIIRATTSSGLQIAPDNSGSLQLQTNGTTAAVTIDTSQNVGIGVTNPSAFDGNAQKLVVGNTSGNNGISIVSGTTNQGYLFFAGGFGSSYAYNGYITYSQANNFMAFATNAGTERMRIDSSGNLLVGTTTTSLSSSVNGAIVYSNGGIDAYRSGSTVALFNRNTNDGTIVSLRQADVEEGTISVSGTTVSYNGGHLSRWSQWQNETGKPEVYRGTVLESTNDMCEWEKDGEPLPNEQATKTIVSTTLSSKAVAGVFDRYDEDDETNPYDFYVAQSGDFVIRIAQGVTVQNGNLLESAGDGTAKPQTDDICRSSTIAKVTSNHVSATYEDGSYCVPCILMIG